MTCLRCQSPWARLLGGRSLSNPPKTDKMAKSILTVDLSTKIGKGGIPVDIMRKEDPTISDLRPSSLILKHHVLVSVFTVMDEDINLT